MAYSKFPEKQRKATGVRWWTGAGGKQFVEFGNGDGRHGSIYPVVSNIDTDSGLTDRKHQPVVWPSIRTLALAGGSPNAVVYGCADCDYAAPHHYQVRPHRNAHRKAKPKVAELSGAVADLKQLIQNSSAAERRIERLTRERDEWKRRATAAEADLAALHRPREGCGERRESGDLPTLRTPAEAPPRRPATSAAELDRLSRVQRLRSRAGVTDAVRCVVCGELTSQKKAKRAGGACGNTECIRTVRERERIERSKRRGS